MAFENESFKIEVREEKGCKIFLTVVVSPEKVKKSYDQAIKNINKEVSLPGFRKGKAPESAIVKQYGNHIDKEWKEILVNDSLNAAIKLTKIYPYNESSIDRPKIESCSLEKGAVINLSYECFPQIPEIDLSTLPVPQVPSIPVEQSAIDEVLGELQKSYAEFEEVPPREVREGDFIEISIDKIDEEPSKPLVQDRKFEVGSSMLPWLKNLVLGLKVGATIDGTTTPDEKTPPIQVRITLHRIKKSILPQLDDAFAKKAGANSYEDLVQKIRANLQNDVDFQLKEKKIDALEEVLLQKYPFELPQSVLSSEVKHRYDEKVKKLRSEGLSEEMIQEKSEELKNEAVKAATHALRLHFLLGSIGKKEKITLTNDEFSDRLRGEMMQNPYYFDIQKKNPELFGTLVRRLNSEFLFEKIRDHLLSKVSG